MSARSFFQERLKELYDSRQIIVGQAIFVEQTLKPDLKAKGISDQDFLDTLRYFMEEGYLRGYSRPDDLEIIALTNKGIELLEEETALAKLAANRPKDTKPLLTTLAQIDARIIAIKRELADVMVKAKQQTGPVAMPILEKVATQIREPFEHELNQLEAKRRAILDQRREGREGFWARLFWSAVVPIAVAIITSLITTYLTIRWILPVID